MEKIIKELEKGNINILSDLRQYAIDSVFLSIGKSENKDEILLNILSHFQEVPEWSKIYHNIFNLIYLDDNYRDYTYYFLAKRLIKPSDLTIQEVRNLFTKKTWGFDYVLTNAEEIIESNYVSIGEFVNLILKTIEATPELYSSFLERFLKSPRSKLREEFILTLIKEELLTNESYILASLYKNPDEYLYEQETLPFVELEEQELFPSRIPCYLSSSTTLDKYKDLLIEHYQEFFMAESSDKLRFIGNLKYVSPEIDKKYHELLRVCENPTIRCAFSFLISNVINKGEEKFITEFTNGEKIEYEAAGTQTIAFRVGKDKILKLCRGKYKENTVTEHFLLAPTEIKVIECSNGNRMYVERQTYLEKFHKGSKIKKKDITRFLNEAKKQGLVITDPLCLEKDDDNFGFLRSYKDANLVGVENCDDLPEWFKKRPLVLYDIDYISYASDKEKEQSDEKEKVYQLHLPI